MLLHHILLFSFVIFVLYSLHLKYMGHVYHSSSKALSK